MGSAFESVKQGLIEAIDHAGGKSVPAKVHIPELVDVAALRRKMAMTQEQFAVRFGISVATLRHWERGDRKPQGPALVLLTLIDREPGAVLRALG